MTVVPGIQISSGVVPDGCVHVDDGGAGHTDLVGRRAFDQHQGIILVPLALLHASQTWSTLRRVAKVELDGEDGGGSQGGQDQDGEGKHLLSFYFFSLSSFCRLSDGR